MDVLQHTKTVTSTRYVKVKLYENELFESIVRQLSLEPGYSIKSITFRVPGGGDWSNMEIDLKEMEFDVVLIKTGEA